MLPCGVSPFFVVILTFVHSSECYCVVENTTYAVGETWSNDTECSQGFICLENNVYNVTECFELQQYIEEGMMVQVKKRDTDYFESCCTNATLITSDTPLFNFSLPGCTRDNETFLVGEEEEISGECVYSVCAGNDVWLRKPCALLAVPEGWNLTAMDKTKPYPECCEKVVPVLDIVPDIIDHLHWGETLQVTYPGNLSLKAGQVMTPTQVQSQPQINYSAEADAFYLLIMIDNDAPSRADPKFREVLHWLVGNIPGNNVTAGETLTAYIGSGAPQGTGLHRYVFLLYKQPGKLQFDEPRVPNTTLENRLNFSVRKFAQKYKLGEPLTYNAFQAEWDEYVPVLHKQLAY